MSNLRERTVAGKSEPLSTAIITAIADHMGVDPIQLDTPLYEVVDPDAVDALFPVQRDATESPTGRLSFSYDGCEVHVASDGAVRVSDARER